MTARAGIAGFACALALTTASSRAEPVPALLDSLAAWHRASNAARVDSVAGPAIASARAAGDATALRALLLARGRTRAAFGLARQSEPDLREVLALCAAADDTADRLEALRWLGVSVGTQGRPREAVRIYHELARLAAAVSDSQQLGWAWIGIAYDHYQAGRAGSAAALYERAAGMFDRAGTARGAAWAWSGHGLAQRQLGDYRGAQLSLRRALAVARGAGDAFNEAAALNYLGRVELQVGDPGRALALLEEALAIHRRHHFQREGALAAIDVATARTLQGLLDAAAAGLDSALADCRAAGLLDLELLATAELADIRLDQERPGAAVRLCRRALARRAFPSAMIATELRLRLAHALAARDSNAAALKVLDSAIGAGTGATSLELQVAADRGSLLLQLGRARAALDGVLPAINLSHTAGASELAVPLLTDAALAYLALGQPDSALTLFRRAADAWEAARALPADPEWRERRSAAASELFSRGAQAMLELPAAQPVAVRVAEAFAFAQRYKARTLLERLQGPSTALSPIERVPIPPPLPAALLLPGEVLLDFVQGEQVTVVFCVTSDTALACVLPGARDCSPLLRRMDDVLASASVRDAAAAREPAAELLSALPTAVRAMLVRAHRVLWCPDGNLHRLPLALLTGQGKGMLLREDCEIARLPAAGLLQRRAAAAATIRDPARVLAITGADSLGRTGLPGAAAETRWLAASLRGVDRLDVAHQGVPSAGAWRDADVVHIASHVRVDVQQPWNTAIVLDSGAEGQVFAAEIGRLQLSARLAVLSGCRTAGSVVVGGEGLLGLASGFVVAGTPAVVATLWPVDDHVAARFTSCFYHALAEHVTAGAALTRARSELRSQPPTSAPRHWAGFVLVGDPGVPVPVRERGRPWPAGVALAVLAAAATVLARRVAEGQHGAGRRSGADSAVIPGASLR